MIILCRLCGSQKSPHAEHVMKFIKEENLWADIYEWITKKLQQLFEKKVNEVEIVGLIGAVSLITKLIK